MFDRKIAVIGAGITGLVAAYVLQQNGLNVEIFERKAEPGGAIKTDKIDGWQIEYGPNTLLLKDREVADFIERLDLGDEMVTANPAASKRFIVKDGKLQALPVSLMEAVKTSLFSLKGKLRVMLEPFVRKSDDSDETVAHFVERRLGKEPLDYAINPFVAGIFASRPEDLSIRHAFPAMYNMEQLYGSLIKGAVSGRNQRKASGRIKRELISFKKGLQTLPNSIAGKLNHLNLNFEINKIEKAERGWMLQAGDRVKGPYTDVILNVPMYKWSTDLLPVSQNQIDILQQTVYQPLSVMLVGYRKSDVLHPLDGFGFLVPEKENRSILGSLFSSTLFAGRAPEDCHLLTVFAGGGRQPEDAGLPSEELFKRVNEELKDLIGLKGKPIFKDHIFWPNSIPAYHPGYDEILDELDRIEKEFPGLHFVGNFRGGISVPDCIKNGLKIGGKLSEHA